MGVKFYILPLTNGPIKILGGIQLLKEILKSTLKKLIQNPQKFPI
jgi:hypothetical protein